MEKNDNSVAIGIGCFHFGIGKNFGRDFTWEKYAGQVRTALESVGNISNVVIDGVKESEFETDFEMPDVILPLNMSDGANPPICDMQVKFDLYLPFRLQEKHLHPIKCKTFTENFKVTINPNYFGIPVVIIELVDPSEEPEPSCSVAAIRKFLEHELPDNDESVIYLDFLGPSPFHANVYLSLKDSADSGDETCEYFEVDVQRRRGYDSICIQANPDIFESLDDAKDFFIYSAIDELSHYYWVIQYKIRRDDQWDDLRRQAEDITSRLGKKGWAGLREKFINLPFILDSAVKSLVEFEIDKIIWDRGQSSCYHDTYDSGEDIPIFKSYIDNELSNIPNYPVNRLSELINFVEGRRAKGVELLVIMVAGLLGGAVGSILTLAFAK